MQHSYHSSSLTDYKGQKNVLKQGYFGGQMGDFFYNSTSILQYFLECTIQASSFEVKISI